MSQTQEMPEMPDRKPEQGDGRRDACRASFGAETSDRFEDRTSVRTREEAIQIVCHATG